MEEDVFKLPGRGPLTVYVPETGLDGTVSINQSGHVVDRAGHRSWQLPEPEMIKIFLYVYSK